MLLFSIFIYLLVFQMTLKFLRRLIEIISHGLAFAQSINKSYKSFL